MTRLAGTSPTPPPVRWKALVRLDGTHPSWRIAALAAQLALFPCRSSAAATTCYRDAIRYCGVTHEPACTSGCAHLTIVARLHLMSQSCFIYRRCQL